MFKKKNCDGFIERYNGISYKNFNSTKQLQNSIIIFYRNRKLINAMGMNGKKLATKNHSKNLNIEKLKSIYNDLITKAKYKKK